MIGAISWYISRGNEQSLYCACKNKSRQKAHLDDMAASPEDNIIASTMATQGEGLTVEQRRAAIRQLLDALANKSAARSIFKTDDGQCSDHAGRGTEPCHSMLLTLIYLPP